MPKTITDPETGEEIEVFEEEEFDEEVEARLQERLEQVKEETRKEWETKLREKEEELNRLKSEFEGLDDKDRNFAKLRAQIKDKEKQIEALKEEFSSEIRKLRTSLQEKSVQEMINNLVGSDEELREKVLYHFNRLSGKDDDPEDVQERIKDAYLLATGGANIDPLKQVASGGRAAAQEEAIDESVKEIGKKMFGLTEEDFEKYAKK